MKPGPKPEGTDVALTVISIRVTERQRAELEQVAAELDMDRSDVIREAVNEFVGDYREAAVFHPRRPSS